MLVTWMLLDVSVSACKDLLLAALDWSYPILDEVIRLIKVERSLSIVFGDFFSMVSFPHQYKTFLFV